MHDIYTIDVRGGTLIKLTSGPNDDWYPTFYYYTQPSPFPHRNTNAHIHGFNELAKRLPDHTQANSVMIIKVQVTGSFALGITLLDKHGSRSYYNETLRKHYEYR